MSWPGGGWSTGNMGKSCKLYQKVKSDTWQQLSYVICSDISNIVHRNVSKFCALRMFNTYNFELKWLLSRSQRTPRSGKPSLEPSGNWAFADFGRKRRMRPSLLRPSCSIYPAKLSNKITHFLCFSEFGGWKTKQLIWAKMIIMYFAVKNPSSFISHSPVRYSGAVLEQKWTTPGIRHST